MLRMDRRQDPGFRLTFVSHRESRPVLVLAGVRIPKVLNITNHGSVQRTLARFYHKPPVMPPVMLVGTFPGFPNLAKVDGASQYV